MAVAKDFIVKNGLQIQGVGSVTATNTSTGALVVGGGAGFNGDVYAHTLNADIIYANNAEVITTATLNVFNEIVDSIVAGTDISIVTSTNYITISNTSTFQSVTDRGSTTSNVMLISNNTSATSTTSGALIVSGGVGVGGDLWIGGILYSGGQAVLTTSSFFSSISEGPDISIAQGNNSTVIIGNTSTLQTVTTRGSSSTEQILLTNPSQSTSTITGALVVSGGTGIGGNLHVGGSISFEKIILTPVIISVGTTSITLDSFSVNEYRSAKYFISISNTTTNQFQTSEIWMVQDGTTAHIEQTSVFTSGTDYVVSFSTSIDQGLVSLIAIGLTPDNKVRMQATYITV